MFFLGPPLLVIWFLFSQYRITATANSKPTKKLLATVEPAVLAGSMARVVGASSVKN